MEELRVQLQGEVLIAHFRCEKLFDDVLIIQIGYELLELVEQPGTKLILDFEPVMFMSSAMMGKIVQLSKKCKANNCELRVCNITPGTMGVFEKRLLNKVFTICGSVQDALNDLSQTS